MTQQVKTDLQSSQIHDDQANVSKPSRRRKPTRWLEIVGQIGIPAVGLLFVVQQLLMAMSDRQQQVMSQYLDQMTELVVSGDLSSDDPKIRTKMTARAITLNALRQLNSERKGQLLRFLYEAGLIGGCRSVNPKTGKPEQCSPKAIIGLETAKLDKASSDSPRPLFLQGAILKDAVLNGADLQKTSLNNSSMSGTKLVGANLSYAILEGADLRGADLSDANLMGADLRNANLIGATLDGANLKDAKYNLQTKFLEVPADLDQMHRCELEDEAKKECKLMALNSTQNSTQTR